VVITTDLTSPRNTIGQVKDSEELSDATGKKLAIYETFNYTTDDKDRILSGTFDRVIFDRTTGEAYHCSDALQDLCDEKTGTVKSGADPTDAQGTEDDIEFVHPGEGTFSGFEGQYFKLPFNTQKQTYQWWDGDLAKATDLKFEKEETLDGLLTYKFVQTIEPTKVGTQDIPASIAGIDQEGNVTVDSIYSNVRSLWIEPETGVLIKGQEQQNNYFEYNGEEVVTTTKAVITYDDATVTANTDLYSPLASQLKILRVWLLVVGLVVGLALVALGAVLLLRRGRAGGGNHSTTSAAPNDSPVVMSTR
jgi:hypothetical protein